MTKYIFFFKIQYCVQAFLAAISGNELSPIQLRICKRDKAPFEIHASLNTSHWTVCMADGFIANLCWDEPANTNVMKHQISFKPNHCMLLLHKKCTVVVSMGGRGVCQNLYFLNIILLYNTDAFTLHTYILFRVLNDVNALYMTCIILLVDDFAN